MRQVRPPSSVLATSLMFPYVDGVPADGEADVGQPVARVDGGVLRLVEQDRGVGALLVVQDGAENSRSRSVPANRSVPR
jgi:hypothetical protein